MWWRCSLPTWCSTDAELRVRVIQRPAVAGPIVEEQRVMIPVTIEWEAFL